MSQQPESTGELRTRFLRVRDELVTRLVAEGEAPAQIESFVNVRTARRPRGLADALFDAAVESVFGDGSERR